MAASQINTVLVNPDRNNDTPAAFANKADAWAADIATWTTEANALSTNVNDNAVLAADQVVLAADQVTLAAGQVALATAQAGDAATSAAEALASEGIATTKAAESAASAIDAANSVLHASVDFTATSTTSLLIELGSKTFTIETGKAFVIGQVLKAASSADPVNEMTGEVTAVSSGSVTLNISSIGGSGTFADWSISLFLLGINDTSENTSETWSSSKIQTAVNAVSNFRNMEVFNTSGIFTQPAGKYWIEGCGGGSGGMKYTGSTFHAGAGGGAFQGFITTSGDLTIVIGSGGTGTSLGSGYAGGDTTVTGTGVSIIGGGAPIGSEGLATFPDGIALSGTRGGSSEGTEAVPTGGGNSAFRVGAVGSNYLGYDGIPNTGAGGGSTTSSLTGGDGASGYVVIMW